ncbi:hypothetical protein [Rhodococcus sp. IEGM 1330]|uniref:aggregation-promoting factor C-terminal-like domain-containing protein n=1 Tax=Rhodococcus sp. IEGM 1330 TaxID=3082225 RepID=UPI0029557805|nr:hypothetical protein [Rhodococcus sp. IEGM 1330]MDV8022259.1 hypothetical protein [Rhodococcus sp. IEGM 1330]
MTSLQGGETFINVLPSMDGYFKRVSAAIKRHPVTQKIDVELDRKSLAKARSDMDKASRDAAAARKKEAAAAGSVIAAEKQLLALRRRGVTDAGRLAAAEGKVARAKRDSRAAAAALNAAESKRSTASTRVTRIETKLDNRRAEADSESFLQRMGGKFGRGGETAGAQFVGGFSKAVGSNAGNDEGRSFLSGFVSAIGTGMRATIAGFTVASSAANSLIRNISTTAMVIGLAARAARSFSVGMLASAVAVQAISGAGLVKLAGVLKLAARAASLLARDIGRVTAALLVMMAVARVVGVLTRLGRALGMVTVGSAVALGAVAALGSVVGNFVAGPMVQGLTAIAAAMGTVAAAAAGILGPAIAVAGLAFAGLSAGAKAWTDAQKSAAGTASKSASAFKAIENAKKAQVRTAEQGNRQIVDAEEQVVDAQKEVKRAQEDVNDARKEASREAEGYARTLKGIALDEEGASLALAEARENLRETLASSDSTATDKWRADLGVREAQQAFDEIKASSAEQRDEIADAQSKGIEGSDRVVDAKEREADAEKQLQDAKESLAQTQKDVAQANIDAAEAVADAYESLAESQQSSAAAADPFAAMIGERLAPLLQAFKGLREEITDRFSGAMIGSFGKLGGLIGALQPRLMGLAGTLGLIGSQIVDSISGPAAMAGWDRMIDGSNRFFQGLTDGESGLGSVFSGLISVLGTAADTFANTGASLNDWLLKIGDRLKGITADDLRGSLDRVRQVFENIGAVIGPLFTLFREFGAEAASGLAPGFSAVGQAITDSLPGLMSMAQVLMPALGAALANLAPILPALVAAFTPWAEILAILAPILATVVTQLAPMAPLLLAVVTAVKLMGLALTIWNAAMFGASVAQGIFAAATGRSAASLGANTIALAAHRVALIAGTVAQTAWNAVMNSSIVTAVRAAAAWVAGRAIMVATSVATGIATAAQWALNAALTANPIGLIIALLAGLVAAVVLAYKNSETFRSIVQAAWQGIQDVVSWAWEHVIQPVLGFFMDKLREAGAVVSWLYDNIVKPYFEFIGSVISTVVDGAMSAFDAFMGGLQKVGDFVKSIASGIESAWNSVRGYLAKPVNFMIDTVFNNGILKAWNAIAGFLPGIEPMMPLATIPEFAKGGQLRGPGTGTSDDILMWGSNDEHMVTAKEVDRAGGHNVVYAIRDMIARGIPFTWDNGQIVRKLGRDNLDRYGAEVAAKGIGNADPAGMFQQLLPKYKDGGEIRAGAPWEKALEGGHEFAQAHHGDPYVWGEWDCSAFMSRVGDKVLGGTGNKNWFTGSFPGTQPWVKGLGQGMSVGVHDNPGGPGGGHAAGTLSAAGPYPTTNIESGGSPSMVKYGIGAAGADSAQFSGVTPGQYHLAIGADGSFESGGVTAGGGPTAQNKESFLQSKIADVMNKALNPIKDTIASAIGSPPPEYLGIPPKYLDVGRDKASGFLAETAGKLGDKLSEAWDKAKDIGNVLTGGLFRDRGGWIPNGRSLVNNETGRPEAILNWDQVMALRDLFTGGTPAPAQTPPPADSSTGGYVDTAPNAFDVDWLGVGGQIGSSLLAEWGNDFLGMLGFSDQFKGLSLVDEKGRGTGERTDTSYGITTGQESAAPAATSTPAAPSSTATPEPAKAEEPSTDNSVVGKVKAAFKPYGWDTGEQWAAADWIIGKESSWNPLARNPESGAFSLFQFLGSTKDQYLPDENPDPYIQGQAGAKYIKDRYGDPLAAKSFWEKNNWYDQGGRATGKGFMLKNVIHPERVLSPRQTEAFEQLVPMLDQMQLATTAPGDVLSQSSRESLEYAPVSNGAVYNVNGKVDRGTMQELGIHERAESRKYTSRRR